MTKWYRIKDISAPRIMETFYVGGYHHGILWDGTCHVIDLEYDEPDRIFTGTYEQCSEFAAIMQAECRSGFACECGDCVKCLHYAEVA